MKCGACLQRGMLYDILQTTPTREQKLGLIMSFSMSQERKIRKYVNGGTECSSCRGRAQKLVTL